MIGLWLLVGMDAVVKTSAICGRKMVGDLLQQSPSLKWFNQVVNGSQ